MTPQQYADVMCRCVEECANTWAWDQWPISMDQKISLAEKLGTRLYKLEKQHFEFLLSSGTGILIVRYWEGMRGFRKALKIEMGRAASHPVLEADFDIVAWERALEFDIIQMKYLLEVLTQEVPHA